MTFTASTMAVLLLLAAPDGGVPQRDRTVQGVRVLDLFLNGGDRNSPLIIAIHGRGSSPERFSEVFKDFPGKVELVLPQAAMSFGPGWSWFPFPGGNMEDSLCDVVAPVEESLWRVITELAGGRKVIVLGFSQGGILSFALAARHPDQIRLAVPIAGGLPVKLEPKGKGARVFAQHGEEDDLIHLKYGRRAVAAFKQAGGSAELREYPGVGHTITQKMRDDLFAQLLSVLKTP